MGLVFESFDQKNKRCQLKEKEVKEVFRGTEQDSNRSLKTASLEN